MPIRRRLPTCPTRFPILAIGRSGPDGDATVFLLNLFLQTGRPARSRSFAAIFRHFGALGLFSLAVLDSSPLPTLSGPDILIAILAATHRYPWYEDVIGATAGSVLGAFLTFRLARGAGSAYLHSRFGKGRTAAPLRLFARHGTGILAASTAIPFPFPTSMFFAAAGASDYRLNRFLTLVTICRAIRYTAIAVVGEFYGRPFIRVLRHPMQYWGWFALLIGAVAVLIAAGVLVHRRAGGVVAPSRRPT